MLGNREIGQVPPMFISEHANTWDATPISDHLEGTVLFNTGVCDMSPNQKKGHPDLGTCNFENLGQMKIKQCNATKNALNTLINN